MAVPRICVDGMERVIVLPEMRDFVHVRRADEAAVEAVGPGVIRALDAPGNWPDDSVQSRVPRWRQTL